MRRHHNTKSATELEGHAFSLSFARRLWIKGPVQDARNPNWKTWRLDEQIEYVTACTAAARKASVERVKRERRTEYLRELEAYGLKLRKVGTVSSNDGESGTAYVWLHNTPLLEDLTDDELILAVGMSRYYGGAGRPFAAEPWVRRRTRRGALVTQFYGLDI